MPCADSSPSTRPRLEPKAKIPNREGTRLRFALDSLLEEAVMSEPVSESPYSLVTGKNTGKPVGPTIRAFLIFGDISGLPVKFPDKETGNLAKASSQLKQLIRVVFSTDQVNSWLPMEHVIERGEPGILELVSPRAGLAAITGLMAAVLLAHIVAFVVTD